MPKEAQKTLLKNCCKKSDPSVVTRQSNTSYRTWYRAICSKCLLHTEEKKNKAMAIVAWNADEVKGYD